MQPHRPRCRKYDRALVKLGRLNHVGVATPSLDKAITFWRDMMGAELIREPFDLSAQDVRVCFVDTRTAR